MIERAWSEEFIHEHKLTTLDLLISHSYRINNYVSIESEDFTGKSQTEALPYSPSDSEVNTARPRLYRRVISTANTSHIRKRCNARTDNLIPSRPAWPSRASCFVNKDHFPKFLFPTCNMLLFFNNSLLIVISRCFFCVVSLLFS